MGVQKTKNYEKVVISLLFKKEIDTLDLEQVQAAYFKIYREHQKELTKGNFIYLKIRLTENT